jgi:hypothetical protein
MACVLANALMDQNASRWVVLLDGSLTAPWMNLSSSVRILLFYPSPNTFCAQRNMFRYRNEPISVAKSSTCRAVRRPSASFVTMAQEGEDLAARYLRESNRCRPLNPAARQVQLYEGDTFPVDCASPIIASSAAAVASRRWLCTVDFCRKSLGQRVIDLTDAAFRRSRLLLALALFIGDKIQRLIPILPFFMVRRIVGAMGRLEALQSMRYFRPLVADGAANPLLAIHVAPLLSAAECDAIIADAEAYAARSGAASRVEARGFRVAGLGLRAVELRPLPPLACVLQSWCLPLAFIPARMHVQGGRQAGT